MPWGVNSVWYADRQGGGCGSVPESGRRIFYPCDGSVRIEENYNYITTRVYNTSKNGMNNLVTIELGKEEGIKEGSLVLGVNRTAVGRVVNVLDGYSKGDGMMIALRCLSPQAIICDEIGSKSDVDAMMEAMGL